jgi:hypothetical protein
MTRGNTLQPKQNTTFPSIEADFSCGLAPLTAQHSVLRQWATLFTNRFLVLNTLKPVIMCDGGYPAEPRDFPSTLHAIERGD